MTLDELNIDWAYLIERVEQLLDMGEDYLGEKLDDNAFDPELFAEVRTFRWRSGGHGELTPVLYPDIPVPDALFGITPQLGVLRRNTRQFLAGFPANNILLWGDRGTGKSSAVKSLLGEFAAHGLRLIEVTGNGLAQLPAIAALVREQPFFFILFCDDLSFNADDSGYRELKSLLEGGVETRPENLLVYATSNRRHLIPEQMSDNRGDNEIHPEEAIAEKLALAERFGIVLHLPQIDESTYLEIVRQGVKAYDLAPDAAQLDQAALLWARQRGGRSGRVARQFIADFVGALLLTTRANDNN